MINTINRAVSIDRPQDIDFDSKVKINSINQKQSISEALTSTVREAGRFDTAGQNALAADMLKVSVQSSFTENKTINGFKGYYGPDGPVEYGDDYGQGSQDTNGCNSNGCSDEYPLNTPVGSYFHNGIRLINDILNGIGGLL